MMEREQVCWAQQDESDGRLGIDHGLLSFLADFSHNTTGAAIVMEPSCRQHQTDAQVEMN